MPFPIFLNKNMHKYNKKWRNYSIFYKKVTFYVMFYHYGYWLFAQLWYNYGKLIWGKKERGTQWIEFILITQQLHR